MTQEDKNILLKDLCARLPYNTNIQVKDWAVLDAELEIGHINRLQNDDLELKPYLRPMSSMTEEEREEYRTECNKVLLMRYRVNSHYPVTDWLNAHHFDYRELIEKGLALEAPEGMYKIE
jgi:hypothetical protein